MTQTSSSAQVGETVSVCVCVGGGGGLEPVILLFYCRNELVTVNMCFTLTTVQQQALIRCYGCWLISL